MALRLLLGAEGPGVGANASTDQLREAKEQAASIIDQANKRASLIVEEAKDKAREEGERIIAGANAEIEQEMNRPAKHCANRLALLR